MKTDAQLQRDVLDQLSWEPSVDAAEIGVTVTDGVAMLTGRVPTYAQKLSAEHAAQRVAGVRAVANDLDVLPVGVGGHNDTEIARAAANALPWRASLAGQHIKVAVSNGWVTLEGEVDWQFQCDVAMDSVTHLAGVCGVVNNVTLKPTASAADVGSRIEAAFRRSADVDAKNVQVDVQGDKVTLRGEVRSWSERQEAERTAWAAPGVSVVENHIAVHPYITAY